MSCRASENGYQAAKKAQMLVKNAQKQRSRLRLRVAAALAFGHCEPLALGGPLDGEEMLPIALDDVSESETEPSSEGSEA